MTTLASHTDTELAPVEFNRLVRVVVDRVSKRIATEIEARRNATDRSDGVTVAHDDGVALEFDRVEQELLAGGWIADELSRLDQARLQAGSPVLTRQASQAVRQRALADLYGMGPLQAAWDDPDVEQIDVNSHRQTWVTRIDGAKTDLGQLWSSAQELTKFQQRLALTMGTGEGRLDTSSPDLTLQAPDGSRISMVLGGPTNHGVSTQLRRRVLDGAR